MKKGVFSKLVVAFIVFANVVFTAAVLYVFYKTQTEPTTLIISWFAFTTGEMSLLAAVKTKKIKSTDDNIVNKDAN
jgi:hypothetical protein